MKTVLRKFSQATAFKKAYIYLTNYYYLEKINIKYFCSCYVLYERDHSQQVNGYLKFEKKSLNEHQRHKVNFKCDL